MLFHYMSRRQYDILSMDGNGQSLLSPPMARTPVGLVPSRFDGSSAFAVQQPNGIIPSMRMILHHLLTSLLSLGLCTACIPSATPLAAPPPAPTTTSVSLYATRVLSVAPPATESGQNTSPEDQDTPGDCQSETTTAIPHYTIETVVNYATHAVDAIQTIDFTNTHETQLDTLVLYIPANKQPGLFQLKHLIISGHGPARQATLEGVRLNIPLPEPLAPGCSLTLRLAFALTVPPIGNPYFPRQGYLGYSEAQFNLALWTPVVAHYHEGNWLTPPIINIGEQTVIPAADYHVQLYVRNAPDSLTVVGPGEMKQQGNHWEFTLTQARDLVITMSPQYHSLITTTRDGVKVELYSLDDAQDEDGADHDPSRQALETAAQALELYTGLYGPYPYDRLVVVESAFPDGMEFSGLVYVGSEWFRSYTGNPASYLTLITAHEVAHQWWYLQVGNDQSREPWLDEALCIYNEYVFLQENYPDLAQWWWNFRIDSFSPDGHVDANVYEFDTLRGYINAVYLQGARLMHAIRQEIGTEEFFNWLQAYTTTQRGQIATAADLWAALPTDALQATAEIRARYLRHSGP